MMVDNLNLSTLISQIPEAQKLHHAQVSHPEAQQALAQELELRRQRQEQKKVVKSEKAETETQVDSDNERESSPEQFVGQRRRKDDTQELEPDQGRLIDTQV